MTRNSAKIFYEGNGHIRSIANIENTSWTFEENTYTTGGTSCDSFDYPCYLDDPYEGELFAVMMYLFAPLGEIDKNAIWNHKRFKLKAINYHIDETD